MTRAVVFIHPDDSVKDAATKMKQLDVGPLPVCDRNYVVGMLTDRDIVIRCVDLGYDPQSAKVSDVMTREVICCYEDEEAEVAERLMQARQVRRILVVNRSARLVGILSLGDLAAESENPQRVGEVLQGVSEHQFD